MGDVLPARIRLRPTSHVPSTQRMAWLSDLDTTVKMTAWLANSVLDFLGEHRPEYLPKWGVEVKLSSFAPSDRVYEPGALSCR
jgi:hypothetical protein